MNKPTKVSGVQQHDAHPRGSQSHATHPTINLKTQSDDRSSAKQHFDGSKMYAVPVEQELP